MAGTLGDNMYYIIGGDNQEYGPVEADQVKEWIADGRADQDTKIREEENGEWRRLGDLTEFKDAWEVSENDVITPEPAMECTAKLVGDVRSFNENYEINIGKLLSTAFSTLFSSSRYWFCVVAVMLPFCLNFILGMIQSIVQLPLVALVGIKSATTPLQAFEAVREALNSSPKLSLIVFLAALYILIEIIYIGLNAVMTAGLFKFFISIIRGGAPELTLCFSGFGKKWGALFASPFLVGVAIVLAGIPLIFSGFALIYLSKTQGVSGIGLWYTVAAAIAFVIFLIPVIYVSVCSYFTIPLIIDREIGCVEAFRLSMRAASKQWLMILLTCIALGLAAIVGLIGFIIGIIFTLPIAYIGMALIYDEIFRKKS